MGFVLTVIYLWKTLWKAHYALFEYLEESWKEIDLRDRRFNLSERK
jgi:hypothetical protein